MPPGRKEYEHRWVEREEREEDLCPSEAPPTSGPPGPPCSMAERSVERVWRERRLRLKQPPPGPPLTIPSLTLVRKSPALPQINARWPADHCTHKGSMLAPQSLNPNICGQASRSGCMGEAKKRIVGDRKRAESPTEGHNALLFCVARCVFAAIPTYLRSASAWEGHR